MSAPLPSGLSSPLCLLCEESLQLTVVSPGPGEVTEIRSEPTQTDPHLQSEISLTIIIDKLLQAPANSLTRARLGFCPVHPPTTTHPNFTLLFLSSLCSDLSA